MAGRWGNMLVAGLCALAAVTAPLSAVARWPAHHAYSHHRSYSPHPRRTHTARWDAYAPRDSHGRIRRSRGARAAFEHQHPCPATGRPRGACPGYVVDHIIALKRGGPDTPSNMQWQTREAARAKDRWE